MENNIINAFMQIFGYSQPICDLFPEWEPVKDEILLPERKTGSGNGTIHIYLQRDNFELLSKCFSSYINNRMRGQNFADEDCPKVSHFCMVSNLACAAALTYHHFKCDDNVFNMVEYLKEVLAFEDKGMIRFDSIFKMSTDKRPYFKQFTKKIFTKLIRSLFISGCSAYKIKLYRNPDNGDIAAFWTIGELSEGEFVISHEDLPQVNLELPTVDIETDRFSISGFIEFMEQKKLKSTTVKNYISVLERILPRLIKDEMHIACSSLLNVTDYSQLIKLDSTLWKVPEIHRYNITGQHQLSAALHNYMKYIESQLSNEELAKLLFKN